MLKTVAGTLAFGIELALLWAAGLWAWRQCATLPLRVAAAAGLVVVLATVWGLLLAPRARRRLPVPARGAAKLALFAAGTWMAWSAGEPRFALIFAVLAAISLVLEYGFRIEAV
jgi:hypothetical protein